MKSCAVRHVPWTCEWGRFGVMMEELGAGRSKVDDVVWGCHRLPALRLTARSQCETCPFWMAAERFREGQLGRTH